MQGMYAAMELVRNQRDELLNEETMNRASRSVLTAEEEAWEEEKKGLLRRWGEEVERLILNYQNDKSLWDAEREHLNETLDGLS